MTKKKKIILISVAVTLALVMGVGGLVSAGAITHMETGGHKLIGVGEVGFEIYIGEHPWGLYQEWDTQFIVTNPNCDKDLTIEWVALIESDEDVFYEGTPDDWSEGPPGIDVPDKLSPHEVWQVSLLELLDCDPIDLDLDKYTLEITWSGAYYSWWLGWGRVRPLTGWQKEKCWSDFQYGVWDYDFPSFAISEAEMQLFPSRIGFKLPRPPVP